jgi:tRNA 2-thiouridine synthesizing protein A
MKKYKLDASGLRCPEPVLQIAAYATEMKEGDILEVIADCPTFEENVRIWCTRIKKELLFIRDIGNGKKKCRIKF